jgi:dolichyl-phosphate beta-glucosyltransferase
MKTEIKIIIPCYNEASRLRVPEFETFAAENPEFFFVFADDGSTDGTGEIITKSAARHPERISCFSRGKNLGKAEIIRQACLEHHDGTAYLGYFDADLATPLEELKKMWEVIRSNRNCEMIIGCRHLRMGVIIERLLLRHYLGRIFATFASIILQIPVYDTQCGAKIFRASLSPYFFSRPFVSRWFFDIEILKRLLLIDTLNFNLHTIIEYPLSTWRGIEGSRLKLWDFFITPSELIKIYFSYPGINKEKLKALTGQELR